MGYREKYFSNHRALHGKYQCAKCGRWFDESDIDVDHVIPKRKGGTDDLWNLQALCYHCNRSKGKNESTEEVATTLIKAGIDGIVNDGLDGAIVNLTKIGKSVATRKVLDTLGVKYRR